MTERVDLAVIGAGPAGLAAALAAWEAGVEKIVVFDRDRDAGGILNQCIHNGFGLHYFGEELTGPEYAERFLDRLAQTRVRLALDTMVLSISPDRLLEAISPAAGYQRIQAGAVVLATGCRERTRGAIGIPGTRPAGVFTAGQAQRYLNLEGYMVGRRVLILGSGDIGLIMARRLTLEGAQVVACVELLPHSAGLTRNLVQCLDDFDIPLLLSHTLINIEGRSRVERVTVAAVDANRQPLAGTEIDYEVDTVLLSVGLIPENELAAASGVELDPRTRGPVVDERRATTLPGFFACGNAVQVHDLVDFVSDEAALAGRAAAAFLAGDAEPVEQEIELAAGKDVLYTVPQKLRLTAERSNVDVFLRVTRVFSESVFLEVHDAEKKIAAFRRPHLTPGETERLVLPRVLLDKATGKTLTVTVREEA